MKHTRRWLALILAIALVAANASYQLGTSLYAKEDQAAVETQSEENQKQEAVNTEEPKSTGSAQVEEVQEDQNTSDDATQAEEVKILRQLQKPPVPQITMQSRTRQISHRQMKMQLQLQLLQMLLQHWLLIQTEASAEAGMIVLR